MINHNALRTCEPFATLSNGELDKITGSAAERQYEAGAVIFHEGESANELFVLQEGKVALQMTLKNDHYQTHRRMTVDIVAANEVFGWPAIIAPYNHTLTAVCLQAAKVLAISANNIRWLRQDNPAAGCDILKGLIKIVDLRLEETRRLLVSERLLTP
ncbi:MAG: cyclic nucleotide-binding domain-containing protein [Chloroflexi bacterium]|nr:cyclic nucleotide-binding domain-containing protein [Chloroflexota bacterium]